MKKSNVLITIFVLLVVVLGVWYFMSSGEEKEVEVNNEITNEIDPQMAEALARWEANCQAEGGEWLTERQFCHKYDSERAEELKLSCENLEGEWLADSQYYECIIDGDKWQYGEWEMIEWEMFKEMKTSCLDEGGEWLGGVEQACEISGDTFYQGRWLVLGEMQESCVNEFGGEWLGGEQTECKIEGVVYPGNWVQIFQMKDTCLAEGGIWLGGENNECKIGDDVYQNQSWQRLSEMRESCESIGGTFKGGEKYRCDWQGKVYYNKSWERAVKSVDMAEACLADGGDWDDNSKACLGLSLEWCGEIDAQLDMGGLGWKESNRSCYIY